MIRGQIDEKETLARMDGVDKFAELIQGSRVLVKLGHRRIDGIEIERRERAAVLTHHGVCRRNGERRQSLDQAEAHLVHDDGELSHDLPERAELTREDCIDGITLPDGFALDFNMGIATFGPFGDI